jgi:hypothetical protein
MKLYCTYELNGGSKVVVVDELLKIRQGFWVDDSGNFSQTSTDAKKFIMPTMIREIRKVEEECYTSEVEGEPK